MAGIVAAVHPPDPQDPAQVADALVRHGPPWLLVVLAVVAAVASLVCFAIALALSEATHLMLLFKWAGWILGPLLALAAAGLFFASQRRSRPTMPLGK